MKIAANAKLPFVEVQRFTRPGDPDSAVGIRLAIEKARETQAKVLRFEAGKYFLKSSVAFKTQGIVHDAGSKGVEPVKDCHLVIRSFLEGLTLQGEVNEAGEPATVFAGMNDLKNHGFLPAILWCEDNRFLKLQNIAFTRDPHFASAGRVIEKTDASVVVEVFEGEACRDDMGAYCMNRLDQGTGALTTESLSYGNGAGANWKQVGSNRLRLESSRVANGVRIGDDLSWHQGAQTDFQTYFARCDNLVLENVRTFNSNGFCMLAEDCHNISAKKIVFAPDGKRLFTGPRDAWKLFKCHGVIDIDDMSVRGVRMDGQNVHANWMFVLEIVSDREVLVSTPYTYAPLRSGTLVEAWVEDRRTLLELKSWSHEGIHQDGQKYKLIFSARLPDGLREGMLLHAQAWDPDSYTCRRSHFENIAGAGHLLRCDRVVLADNVYRNLMNSGVILGAELPTHREGGHADDVVVTRNIFDNCGFVKRGDIGGGVGIHSNGFSGAFNQRIAIVGNTFRNMKVGIEVKCARDVWISGNHFDQIGQRVEMDAGTTREIYFSESNLNETSKAASEPRSFK